MPGGGQARLHVAQLAHGAQQLLVVLEDDALSL